MRIGILSDIHGNFEALQAVLEALGPTGEAGPLPDAICCLGDLVGYGPDPNACVDLVRASGWQCVAGNHDLTGAGGAGLDAFNPAAATALKWTRNRLTGENRAFLSALPRRIEVSGVTLAHGSPREPIWEYVLSTQTAGECFDYFATPLCLVGHTHMPAYFQQSAHGARALIPTLGVQKPVSDGRFIVNPGSVGQPRDGDSRAAFAILDLEQGVVFYHRVAYPVARTQEKMLAAGLPARLAARLDYGW